MESPSSTIRSCGTTSLSRQSFRDRQKPNDDYHCFNLREWLVREKSGGGMVWMVKRRKRRAPGKGDAAGTVAKARRNTMERAGAGLAGWLIVFSRMEHRFLDGQSAWFDYKWKLIYEP